ncbi:MAG: sterol desaturase family protein [Ferruginibacter sp.]|nr:sterol desaturase family protein [Ferruginibacter sp.]
MKLNYLSFAIPFFVGFMVLEYYLSGKKKSLIFRFEEAIANLSVGLTERFTDLITGGLFYFFFKWLYENYAIFNISTAWYNWVALFLVTDLVYYWYHRFGHKVNILWSVHVVHHQSEDYNYTTSVRVTLFQAVGRSLFWSVLPILGFSPAMVTTFLLIHGAYPFFTHTQLIGKLGILEYFLVTPSHHRVHHSSNPEYLDKNYGDILIIWDKMFGTFAKETVAPVYGITKPLNSYSFLWQMFHFQLELLYALKKAKGFLPKLKVIFGKPDDIDPRIRSVLEKKLNINQGTKASPINHRFILLQSFFNMCFVFFVILFSHYQTALQITIAGVFLLFSMVNTGAILERKQKIFYIEFIRFLLLSSYIYLIFPNYFTLMSLLSFNLLLLLFSKTITVRYDRWLFS